MNSILRHVRHAIRMLVATPVFAVTAVLSLAIGIGANTAIFTAANAIFLAPTAGVKDMSRLVDIGRTDQRQGFDTVSFGTYSDLRDRDSVFAGVFALRLDPQALSLGGEAGAERVYGHLVSTNYFSVLGLEPGAGRFFDPSPERPGVPVRQVVLSHAFWLARFEGKTDVIGQDVVLNGDRFTIAGVGPPGYRGSTILAPDLWIPLTSQARGLPTEDTLRGRENSWLTMGGRLKPGVSVAQAQSWLNGFSETLAAQYPDVYRGRGLVAAAASRAPGVGREFVAPFLAVLMGVAGLVLLVTCTNLAGMMLARGAGRSREVAVRLALGASRRSLIGLLMTESLLLSAAGMAAALLIAWLMSRSMAAFLPTLPFPVAIDLATDWRVVLFAFALALATAVVTGLTPALQSVRRNLVPDLKSDSSAPRRQRLRHVFITAQLAFCLVLIVVAGLFLRALGTATRLDPGFNVANVDVASLELTLGGYTEAQSPAVAEQIRERLAALPGVERVGFARMVPLDGGGLGLGGLRRHGSPDGTGSIDTDWNVVSPDFLSSIGIPILRGRGFGPEDRTGAPRVAIVNERLASMVWPGQDPVGQRLENGDFRQGRESTIETLTVVGVARNAKYRWIGEADAPFIYVPYAQQPLREVNYFLRRPDAGGPSLQREVRKAIAAFDPNLPLVRMQSLQSYADLGTLPQQLAASIAGGLGLVALLLAGLGVYGVTAFAVASRTREIGVRMALGADQGRVVRMVLWQGARLAAIGGGIGLGLSIAVTQLISGLLFGVSPLDPVTYGGTVGALALVTLAGTFVPARRAAAVNPVSSLKTE